MAQDKLEKTLEKVDPEKRSFLKTLIATTAFAVPTFVSFSMDGLSRYEANAQASNLTSR